MVLGGVHFTKRWKMGDHFETPSGVLFMASMTSSASMVLFHDSASEPVTWKLLLSVSIHPTTVLIATHIVVDDPHNNVFSCERQSV